MKTINIIFGITQEDAERKMNELYNEDYVVKTTKNYVESHFEFFKAVKWHPNQRGCKAHEIYVDMRIDQEEINTCIIPRLLTEHKDGYKWQDHIHYF